MIPDRHVEAVEQLAAAFGYTAEAAGRLVEEIRLYDCSAWPLDVHAEDALLRRHGGTPPLRGDERAAHWRARLTPTPLEIHR